MRDAFWQNHARLEEIDAQLDPTTASKTKVLNGVVSAHQDTVDSAVKTFNDMLASFDAERIVAVVHSLRKEIRKHQDTVDTYVKEHTPENGEQVSLSPDQVNALNNERTELVNELRAGRAFITSMDPDANLPKISARQKGVKRAGGPRLKGTYNFSVDGEPVDGHTLSDVRKATDAESVAAIRKAILDQNNANDEFWGQENERFEFTINGKRVVAKLAAPSDSGDDDEDVDVDEDDDSDDDELFQ
jgi:hypothetical protein